MIATIKYTSDYSDANSRKEEINSLEELFELKLKENNDIILRNFIKTLSGEIIECVIEVMDDYF